MKKNVNPLAAFLGPDALEWLEWLLSEGADPVQLLPAACMSERQDIIEILLNSGADPNSGMRMAVNGPRSEVLAMLLQRGADPDYGTASRTSVILSPSHITYAEVVKALVEAGANPNVTDDQGGTPLHLACSPLAIESAETVQLLLTYGGDVAAKDKSGSLPIHCAAETGSVAIVETLLRLGAQPNVQDASGRTPLARARIRRERWNGQQPDVGPEADWDGVCKLLGE